MPFAHCFDPDAAPWEWIKQIKVALDGLEYSEVPHELPSGVHIEGKVVLHESVKLPAFCSITGPCWIGEGVEIRPGAYIRGNLIAGPNCVLGNSSEFKNCLLIENVQVPHFSYVGDSVLGAGVHLGAGTILSNLRLDQKSVHVKISDNLVDTGMRKLGAIMGDESETGSNAALMPGSIVGKKSLIGPVSCFKGVLPEASIWMEQSQGRIYPRRDI